VTSLIYAPPLVLLFDPTLHPRQHDDCCELARQVESRIMRGSSRGQSERCRQHIAQSVNGCGTTLYGKRDFGKDGSFVTTKWFVVFFVPVFPLSSMRVKVIEHGYLVRQKNRSHLKQVVCVYSYLLLLLLAATSVNVRPRAATAVLLAAVLPLPWLLRTVARAGIVNKPRLFEAGKSPGAR
jgi:hypothetical protein